MTDYPKNFVFKRVSDDFQLTAYLRYNRDIVTGVILTKDLKTDFCSMEVMKVQDKGEEQGLRKVSNTSQLYVFLPGSIYKSNIWSKETRESTHPGFSFDGFVFEILKDDTFTLEMLSQRQAYFLSSPQDFKINSDELNIFQDDFIKAFEGVVSPLKEGFPQSLDMESELKMLPNELREFIERKLGEDSNI